MIKLGNNDIQAIYLGTDEVEKVYLGNEQVYPSSTPPTPPHDYSQDYLTFVALEDGTFKFSGNSVDYSVDNGQTWTSLASNTDSPTVTTGNKILWKATGLTPSLSSGIGTFSSTGRFEVEGNAMTLRDGTTGGTVLSDYQFRNLFNGATGLTSAENLVLPATTLVQWCYYGMFQGCSSLTTAPALPATTSAFYCYSYMFGACTSLTTAPALPATALVEGCYYGMFDSCTSLTTAPALPATALTEYCYQQMFRDCTSLTTAPALSATTLVRYCYRYMFQNCTSLNSITCLATNISAVSCTKNWLNGVSSTGTFTKAASMNDWSSGISGIPTGWSVVEV